MRFGLLCEGGCTVEASAQLNVFGAATALFSLALLLFAVVSFASKRPSSNWLAASCTAAVVVLISYLESVNSAAFFEMSLLSSVYFSGIDVMLVTLLIYLMYSKKVMEPQQRRAIAISSAALAAIDCASLMLNPFTGPALGSPFVDRARIDHWVYEPYLAYDAHLLFCYAAVTSILALLVYKTLKTPAVYHARYVPIAVMIVLIVLVNAIFLYLPFEILDISVLLYAFCAGFICFNDTLLQERMLRRRVGDKVLDSLKQPVVFFDNECQLCFHNVDADFMLPGHDDPGIYTLEDFVSNNGLERDIKLRRLPQEHSFRWSLEHAGGQQRYRCDFHTLRDAKRRVIGYLFVFIDISLEVDVLTGFQTKEALARGMAELQKRMLAPSSVCLLDINRLAELNAVHGRERGDDAIKALTQFMRDVFPAGTEFARMDDAAVLACCPGMRQREAREHCAAVARNMAALDFGSGALGIQSAIAELTWDEPRLSTAISLAQRSLSVQKMLDPDSAHSSLLDSLDQTMRESDATTEAHVRRTRALAAKLGERLELSDYDQSSLALLCLLHDIGKLGIPLEILNKPTSLTEEEWDLMRSHTEKGYRIAMASEELREIAPCILHHHECWDGSGYPDGLKAEAIPLLSRIVAVVDTYDAMTSDRPYREALSVSQARAELQRCAGTQLDPFVVAQFLNVLDDMGLVPQQAVAGEEPAVSADSDFVVKGLPRSFTASEYEEGAAQGLAAVDYMEYTLDDSDHIIEIDERFTRVTGYTPDDIKALHPRQIDLIFPDDAEMYKAIVTEQLMHGSDALVEHRIRRKDGSARNVICYGRRYYDSVTHELRVNVIAMDAARSAIVNMLLKQERERAHRRLAFWEHGARADSLTGVLNHQSFVNAVQELAASAPCRMLMCVIDLDNFKSYNDLYGHPRGDDLLVSLAEVLLANVPERGMVGRLGGDEFALAAAFEPGCSDEDVLEDVKRMWSNVIHALNRGERPATISLGAYFAGAHRFEFQPMYDAADAALYAAKEAGRRQLRFESPHLSGSLDLAAITPEP